MAKQITLICILAVISFCSTAQEIPPDVMQKAISLNSKALVIDGHGHSVYFDIRTKEALILGYESSSSPIDIGKMKKGGVKAIFTLLPYANFDEGQSAFEGILDQAKYFKEHVSKLPLASNPLNSRDLAMDFRAGKICYFLGIEGKDIFDGDISRLQSYYDAGVRMITLSNSQKDQIASFDPNTKSTIGLTDFGKNLIHKMNDLGMIIDITHEDDQMQLDVIEESAAPVVASHSNSRSIVDIPRGIPDNIVRKLAEKDGIIMVTFYPGMVSSSYAQAKHIADSIIGVETKALEEKMKGSPDKLAKKIEKLHKKYDPTPITTGALVHHIDYLVKLVGADHVGFGSDFGGRTHTTGLEDASGIVNITAELIMRGYSDIDIRKILGGNMMRVLKKAEEIAVQ